MDRERIGRGDPWSAIGAYTGKTSGGIPILIGREADGTRRVWLGAPPDTLDGAMAGEGVAVEECIDSCLGPRSWDVPERQLPSSGFRRLPGSGPVSVWVMDGDPEIVAALDARGIAVLSRSTDGGSEMVFAAWTTKLDGRRLPWPVDGDPMSAICGMAITAALKIAGKPTSH